MSDPSKRRREEVRQRDGGKCRGCGALGYQIHHIKFRSQGGGHELTNLVLVCDRCHNRAHNLQVNMKRRITPELWRAVLRSGGTVEGLKLKQNCYSCLWRDADAFCAIWEMEVAPDYVCENWKRKYTQKVG